MVLQVRPSLPLAQHIHPLAQPTLLLVQHLVDRQHLHHIHRHLRPTRLPLLHTRQRHPAIRQRHQLRHALLLRIILLLLRNIRQRRQCTRRHRLSSVLVVIDGAQPLPLVQTILLRARFTRQQVRRLKAIVRQVLNSRRQAREVPRQRIHLPRQHTAPRHRGPEDLSAWDEREYHFFS